MAAKSKSKPTSQDTVQQTRLWLMYPPKLIKKPLIWELGHKFKVVTNIRQCQRHRRDRHRLPRTRRQTRGSESRDQVADQDRRERGAG
ncbi:MAG: hypothetical protein V9H26_27465 [Verrucomicrobiota bacterium]